MTRVIPGRQGRARPSGAQLLAARAGRRTVAIGAALAAAAASTIFVAGPAAASSGQVVIAASTYTGIDVARQADGSPTWSVQQAGAGTYGSPAVAIASNGTIVVTAVDLAGTDRGTLYYFWEAAGSSTWHREQVSAIGAAALYVTPSIASQTVIQSGTPISLAIVDQDQNDSGSTLYLQPFGAPNWSSEAIPTADGTASAPTVTEDANDTTVITYGTADGFGFDRLVYNTTSDWESIQDIDVGHAMSGMQAVDEAGGRIEASGTENGIIWFFYNANGSTGGWYGQDLGVGAMDGASMAVDTAAGNTTLAAYDPGDVSGQCVYVYTQQNGSNSWSVQSRADCPGWAGPPVVSVVAQPNGNLVMALMASNQQVQFYWAPSGTDQWNNEVVSGIVDPGDYSVAIAAD
jgi:hypothetical protein